MTTQPRVDSPAEPDAPGDWQLPAFYRPNLIAAIIAAIMIAVGGSGPWVAVMDMTRSNIGDGGDGKLALMVGSVAALTLFPLLKFGRATVRTTWFLTLGAIAAFAGAFAFFIGLLGAEEVTARSAEVLGSNMVPEIGWGLWMILIGGPVLAITAGIVLKHVTAVAQADI